MLNNIDIAFTNKVRDWFPNTQYAPNDLVYNVAYSLIENSELSLTYPLINIYRPSGFEVASHKTVAARHGGYNIKTGEEMQGIRYLPINLKYQLDIYAKSIEDLNTITENIIFAFDLDPILTVDEGFGVPIEYETNISSNVVEQSEFQSSDRIFHYAVVVEVKNARLYNIRNNIKEIKEVLINLSPKE